jgi:hypothetical protein
MMMNDKGKAYANKKPLKDRPIGDFYRTPQSLVWELIDLGVMDKKFTVYCPAAGDGRIVKALRSNGFNVVDSDIVTTHKDFLEYEGGHYHTICENPPWSLWDKFVMKAKEVADHVFFIGKVNFFGAYKRHQLGVWRNLKQVYIFNRQVDYRSPYNKDGYFCVGNIVSAWFEWDIKWNRDWWKTSVINVNDYAKLGQFKEK